METTLEQNPTKVATKWAVIYVITGIVITYVFQFLNVDQNSLMRKKISGEISRKTLRFCYTMSHRVAQYVNEVKCKSTTHYIYSKNADPYRFIDLLQSGIVKADDELYANDCLAEDVVLEKIHKNNWVGLIQNNMLINNEKFDPMKRLPMYSAIDRLRQLFPVGDR